MLFLLLGVMPFAASCGKNRTDRVLPQSERSETTFPISDVDVAHQSLHILKGKVTFWYPLNAGDCNSMFPEHDDLLSCWQLRPTSGQYRDRNRMTTDLARARFFETLVSEEVIVVEGEVDVNGSAFGVVSPDFELFLNGRIQKYGPGGLHEASVGIPIYEIVDYEIVSEFLVAISGVDGCGGGLELKVDVLPLNSYGEKFLDKFRDGPDFICIGGWEMRIATHLVIGQLFSGEHIKLEEHN